MLFKSPNHQLNSEETWVLYSVSRWLYHQWFGNYNLTIIFGPLFFPSGFRMSPTFFFVVQNQLQRWYDIMKTLGISLHRRSLQEMGCEHPSPVWHLEKKPGWLGHIGDGNPTQLYRDFFISHYKDPYYTNQDSMESMAGFFRGSVWSRFDRSCWILKIRSLHQLMGFIFSEKTGRFRPYQLVFKQHCFHQQG